MPRAPIALVAFAISFITACDSNSTSPEPSPQWPSGYSITVEPSLVFLAPGDTVAVLVSLQDSTGQDTTASFTYSVVDPTVATALSVGSHSGAVVGAGLGSTTVHITSANLSAVVSVLVLQQGTIVAHEAPLEFQSVEPWGVGISGPTVMLANVQRNSIGFVARASLPATTFGPPLALGSPTAIAFHQSDGLAFVADAPAWGMSTIDLATNTVVDSLPDRTFDDDARAVISLPSSTDLLVAAGLTIYRVASMPLGVPSVLAQRSKVVTNLLPHPSLPVFYVSGGTSVAELDQQTGQELRLLAPGGALRGIALSPSGDTLFAADEAGALIVWDVVSNTLIRRLPTYGMPFGAALNAAGSTLALTVTNPGRVYLFDTRQLTWTTIYAVGGAPRGLAFTSGGIAVVANESGWVDFLH